MAVKILFVCLGNICRSPTAHGVFETQVQKAGLQQQVIVDSAGTGDWHIGAAPDHRSRSFALGRGYDLSSLRARQIGQSDFLQFDYILAMDNSNLTNLHRLAPAGYAGHLGLFLEFHPEAPMIEVPDPYYGGDKDFNIVLDLIEAASSGLLAHVRRNHGV